MKDGEIFFAYTKIGRGEEIFLHRRTGCCHFEVGEKVYTKSSYFPHVSTEMIGVASVDIDVCQRIIIVGPEIRAYSGPPWSRGETGDVVGLVSRYPDYVDDSPIYDAQTGCILAGDQDDEEVVVDQDE